MRKLFTVVVLTTLSLTVLAQKAPAGKKLNWGIKSGINIARFGIDETNAELDWRIGFTTGAFFRIKAGNKFTVQPEFAYSSLGGNMLDPIEGESKYRLNYFSVPLLANYSINQRWRAIAGPQFDFLINAKQEINERENKVDGDFDDNTFSVTGGLEFWPTNGVGFSARYIHGLSDANRAGTSIKNRAIQLSLALKL